MEANQIGFNAVKRKYASHIIYITGVHKNVRFTELQPHLNLSDPTISERLDDLEEAGFLKRTSYDEMPPRVEYALTHRGDELFDHLSVLFDWAADRDATLVGTGISEDAQNNIEGECLLCGDISGSDVDDRDKLPWFQTLDGLVDRIVRKNVMQIVVEVAANEPCRYSVLKDATGMDSDKLFSNRLRELRDAGLVERRANDENSSKTEYSLSSSGDDLAQCLIPLLDWADRG